MSTHEERLAALLQSSDAHTPGDALSRIRMRVRRRRCARAVLVPGVAVGVAVAVAVAALLVLDTGGSASLEQTGDPKPGSSTGGLVEPSPTADPNEGVDFYAHAFWPFTSRQQADTWREDHGLMPWAGDKAQVVEHYVTDFLHLDGLQVDKQCPECFEQFLQPKGTPAGTGATIGEVAVSGDGTPGQAPYAIVNTTHPQLSVTTPEPDASISSPLALAGNILGADEDIAVRLISSDGRVLASATAPSGAGSHWSAALTWSDSSWTHAAIVGVTRSSTDGSIDRVFAESVTRQVEGAPEPSKVPGPAFAGVTDGHIDLYDSTTGALRAELTDPPEGQADTELAYSTGSLLWVRRAFSRCHDVLLETAGEGGASTVVSTGDARLSSPRLSKDGRWGAWLETACGGSSATVVVQETGNPSKRVAVPPGTRVLDVDSLGAVLLRTGDAVTTVDAGATTLSQGSVTTAETGCTMTDGVVLFGHHVDGRPGPSVAVSLYGFEDCGSTVGLINNYDGAAHPNGPRVAAASLLSLSYGPGGLLVTYQASVGGPSLIAGYQQGNGGAYDEGFRPALVADGSVLSADW